MDSSDQPQTDEEAEASLSGPADEDPAEPDPRPRAFHLSGR